jgi:hypothetical protein
MNEREWQVAKAEMRSIIRELEWELGEWEHLARELEEAYANCGGQLTEELKEAIENIIANIPHDITNEW